MTTAEEKTNPKNPPTLELVLTRVNEVGHDVKLAVNEAREANAASRKTMDIMLKEHEMFKSFDERLRKVERFHIALPVGSAILAFAAIVIAFLNNG